MRTKVTKQHYKGHPTISIWEVDPAGNPLGKYPVVSFGTKKAQAIFTHVIDIQMWLDENNMLPEAFTRTNK